MIFEAHRTLMSLAVGAIASALQKNRPPSDPSRYIFIRTGKDYLEFAVARDGMCSIARIDASGADEMLKIGKATSYAVHGEKFAAIVMGTVADGFVRADFEDSPGELQPDIPKAASQDTAQDASAKAIAPTGALKLRVPSPAGSKNDEEYWLQTVDLVGPKSPDAKVDSDVKMSGREFSKLVQQVGIAVGKNIQSVDNSNVLIRQAEGSPHVDIVTFNGYQLGWAKAKDASARPLVGLVQYEDCLAVAKLVDPEREVVILKPGSSPDGIIVSQDLVMGTAVIGKVQHRIYSISDKFAKFEKMIKALSFNHGFKAKKQQFQYAVGRLGIEEQVRATLVIDPQSKTATFSKSAPGLRMKGITLPIENVQGSERLELEVSSKYLQQGIAQCDGEDVELSFSGRQTLAKMTISDAFEMYFQPFGGK